MTFGAMVFRLRPGEPASWPFFLFCAGMAFGLLDYRFTRAVLPEVLTIAGLCLLAPSSMHFVFNLGGSGFAPRLRKWVLPVLYAGAAALTPLPWVIQPFKGPAAGQSMLLVIAVWVSCAVSFSLPLLAYMAARSPIVLNRQRARVLLSGALTIIYAAGLVLLNAGFAGKVGGTGSPGTARLVLFVIVSVVIVFFLDRARGFAQTLVDRLFFRHRVDYRRALLQTSEAMASRLLKSEIIDSALGAIRDAMGVDWGAVFLAPEGGQSLALTGSFGEGAASLGGELGPDAPLVQHLGRGRQAVSRYDREVRDNLVLAERFAAANAALAVPLVVEEKLIGLLLLGGQRLPDLVGLRQAYEKLSSAQTRLVQAEKMASLGSLVAGITHEFNSPVGVIVAANDVIQRSIDRIRASSPGAEAERALKVVTELTRTNRESCSRIVSIVRNLKSFARLDEAERKA